MARRMPTRATLAIAACAAVAALAGCGLTGPPRTTTSATTTTEADKLATAQAKHEYPSPPPPPETTAGGAPTPEQAIRDFASLYINWTAETVADHMRVLAAATIGQARSAMALAATQTGRDYELQRGGIANSGTVEAVAPLRGHRDQYVVVTRETTTATNTNAYEGLGAAWHVTLATAVEVGAGQWTLSGWQPEN
jgi:hypothetical protein